MEQKQKEQLSRIDSAMDEVKLLAQEDLIPLSTYKEVKRGFDAKLFAIKEEERLAQLEEKADPQEESIKLNNSTPEAIEQESASAPSPTVPEIVKKQRSPEENRQRRLTYILTSGVALLLLGGVLLALTNWLVLADTTKVFLISGIAIVFAGMSYLANKLKIRQTMFAFLMLFAFFVPIVFFSISYYGVLGPYLSIGGEGSMLFAAIASLLCAALYAFLHRMETHLVFQIVTLVATGASSLYAAGYVTATVDMYILTLSGLVFVQLILWNKGMNSQYLQAYRLLLPWFVLSQLILVSFIQFAFFGWAQGDFLNVTFIGMLYYLIAVRHSAYNGLSVPGVLGFSIGLNGLISSNQYMYSSYYALTLLILPAILLAAYEIEKKNGRDKILYVPIKIIFLITVVMTHLVGQLMLLIDESSLNLYALTLIGATALFMRCSWFARSRVSLFFGYLLSAYTIWLLLTFYMESLIVRSILMAIVLIASYTGMIFVQKINIKLIRHPLKLATSIALLLLALQLSLSEEWGLLTGLLLVITVLASLFSRFEQAKVKSCTEMVGVGSLFFAVITSHSAIWSNSLVRPTIETANHYLIGAVLVSAFYFLYKRLHGKKTAERSFIAGGLLFIIMFFHVLFEYPLMATTYAYLLTIYAVVLTMYFLMATIIVFKKEEFYWGVIVFSIAAYMSLLHYSFAESSFGFWSVLLASGGVFTWIGRGVRSRTTYGSLLFYTSGQALLLLVGLAYVAISDVNDLSIHGLLVPFAFLLVEVISSRNRGWRIGQSIVAVLYLLLHNLIWFNELPIVTGADSLLLTGALILLCMLWKPLSYNKNGVLVGLGILNIYPIAIMLVESTSYGLWKVGVVLLISVATIYYIEEKWKRVDYSAIPYVLVSMVVLLSHLETLTIVILLLILAFAGKAAGVHYMGWSLIQNKRVNSYQIISTILVVLASMQLRLDTIIATELELTLATVLLAYLVLLFIKEQSRNVRYVKAVTLIAGFYYPYSLLLSLLPIADEYVVFLYAVPFMILVSLLLRVVAKEESWRPPSEMVVVVGSFVVMSLSTLANQTLYGSLTLSILAVIAILAGFYLKYAAYFITGVVALLVNTLYATRVFWFSIPWWVYLMAGGAILIGFATYQELKKREDETTIREQWQQLVRKMKGFFKQWK
ncbi:hypothetical protein [Alkalicoccobacillus murimartini]|uniref:DUF2339 domain-containing protein n=1 Tax=Alkalicoccobacillus murimartini TaxID=171685 RepID=A0ABT9YLN6_9BACI|nr:hypothetical protein [Alkalicoccobacillus murimartini]MDQ0208791.1 hypothetical protein [Alkalicoccobacillus murimartini]